jgi:uncharacterized protein
VGWIWCWERQIQPAERIGRSTMSPAWQHRGMRRWLHVGLALVVGVAFAGCSGDDDEAEAGSTSETTTAEVLESAGDAAAAMGAGLDEPPGAAGRVPLEGFGEVAIAVTDADGEVQGYCVLAAEDPEQRSQGLMQVTDLQGYDGMLFVWDADSSSSFYMRNTPSPLSIAWFEADGDFVSSADMAPCADVEGCPLYPSAGPYRYALEVLQGDLPAMGVGEGSRLRVGGECAPRAGET